FQVDLCHGRQVLRVANELVGLDDPGNELLRKIGILRDPRGVRIERASVSSLKVARTLSLGLFDPGHRETLGYRLLGERGHEDRGIDLLRRKSSDRVRLRPGHDDGVICSLFEAGALQDPVDERLPGTVTSRSCHYEPLVKRPNVEWIRLMKRRRVL